MVSEKRIVCVMAIGGGQKYLEQYSLVKDNIMAYAKKCHADFDFIQKWIDPAKKRTVYGQKLLIPYAYKNYDKVLFLDLDILISPKCPDLFDMMKEGIGLMAMVSPRGSEKFRKVYSWSDRILNETTESFFTSRNFELCEGLVDCINGGVLLFRPALIADLLKSYYESDHDPGTLSTEEEPAMAYLSQKSGIFQKLDMKFNCQPYFEIGTPEASTLWNIHHNQVYRRIENHVRKWTGEPDSLLVHMHYKFIKRLIDNGAYIIHFAGGWWNTRLYKKCVKIWG